MAYDIYYPGGCDSLIPDHYCNDCETPEKGRIGSSAFIKDSFEFTNPSNAQEWINGIENKDIIIIPRTNGSFDGGSEVETTGYGRQATTLSGYNFQAIFNDPNYKLNADFYNEIKRSRNYRYAYVTETLVHITDVPVSVVPKNPVQDDITSDVVWNVTVKWASKDLPVPYDVPPGIFECFDYTGSIS